MNFFLLFLGATIDGLFAPLPTCISQHFCLSSFFDRYGPNSGFLLTSFSEEKWSIAYFYLTFSVQNLWVSCSDFVFWIDWKLALLTFFEFKSKSIVISRFFFLTKFSKVPAFGSFWEITLAVIACNFDQYYKWIYSTIKYHTIY